MAQREIVIRGAAEHNLKGISLRIPRGTLTTVTGVSGSGKSSLAFDTLHAEGQRRFLESLSAYARQFLGEIEKPKVEHVEGLSPTLAIDQKTVNRNPRSTVGTVTEIYDHLRLLFARLGEPHCPKCGAAVAALAPDQITDSILRAHAGEEVWVLAPIVRERKGEYRKELEDLRERGFVRVRVDGEVRRLDGEPIRLARYEKHTIEALIDRIRASPEKRSRIAEAVEQALEEGKGTVAVLSGGGKVAREFSSRLGCPKCGTSIPEMEPRLFSFNNPEGACPDCGGLGVRRSFDPRLIVPDTSLSIRERAIAFMVPSGHLAHTGLGLRQLEAIGKKFGFTLDQPWRTLTAAQRKLLLHGSGGQAVEVPLHFDFGSGSVRGSRVRPLEGILPALERAHRSNPRPWHEKYLREAACATCGGSRLRSEALAVTFRGKTIADATRWSVEEAALFAAAAEGSLDGPLAAVGRPILKEIRSRLAFLAHVGLSYLTLDRSAATLSGGEAQRVRLAAQVGARLRGVLYVLDEPSIGLHPVDHRKLLDTLHDLRDLGNTVIVVEHDRDTMEASDHIVDVGPGAGRDGGEIVGEGTIAAIEAAPRSVTGQFLSGKRSIPVPASRRAPRRGQALVVRGAREHNLKRLTVRFPLGVLTVVTGVSGSGKSTLVIDVLKKALARELHGSLEAPGAHDAVAGAGKIDKVIEIDQAPIGRTPRSNPATYTGVFDEIRALFARLPEAAMRGYRAGRFSFNVKGGRCEACGGAGVREVEMQFLANVEVPCEACVGKRFNRETLEVRYRGKTITDVLEMRISDALAFFASFPKIRRVLETLDDVGLSYVALGQPSTTLSGGEAQRVKLATELCRPATGRTLYILDEPTTGLHFADIERLVATLGRLVDAGNTVVVIEHNLDVIKVADWIVDLGPEGGAGGGRLIAEGTPEAVARAENSATGRVLREALEPARRAPRPARPAAAAREASEERALRVSGARKNNLRGIDVEVPHDRLTVVTGVSGSGKTSLAFDTIFAEGQRRFLEALSTYARRFLGRFEQASVDRVDGLSPAIAIDQKNSTRNPRSTVATTTEIHDYLRLLYARAGKPHCPECGTALESSTPTSAAAAVLAASPGRRLLVAAPLFLPGRKRRLALDRPEHLPKLVPDLRKEGFLRLLVGDEEVRLDGEGAALPRAKGARPIHLVVDRAVAAPEKASRLAEAFEQAFEKGHGLAAAIAAEGDRPDVAGARLFSEDPECFRCGFRPEAEPSPRTFSFNSQFGACTACAGVGLRHRVDPTLLIRNPDRPLLGSGPGREGAQDVIREGTFYGALVRAGAQHGKIDVRKPWSRLSAAERGALLDGPPGGPVSVVVRYKSERPGSSRQWRWRMEWPGLVPFLEKARAKTEADPWGLSKISTVTREMPCPSCGGARLRRESLAYRVGGKSIAETSALTVAEAARFFRDLSVADPGSSAVVEPIRAELSSRLRFLEEVGLEYLALDRRASTLSGGEAQRIRLAKELGSRLVGVLYVLDEPTIGLHPRDTEKLLATLRSLRDLGNTLVVVEHDPLVIRSADHVLDLGPGAGRHGGELVAAGTVPDLLRAERSVTGAYLSGRLEIPVPATRRGGTGEPIVVRNARANNLKGIDVAFPRGALTAVTGVSGSGKSSLVMEALRPALEGAVRREAPPAERGWDRIEGTNGIERLLVIDQSPIGRTPSSNPATYSGIFDEIRDLFAEMPQSRVKGFSRSRFSFNSPSGRCPACEGRGYKQVEMHFLSDVWIPCDVCDTKRFNSETLLVQYRGKTIADVLDLDVEAAAEFFAHLPRVQPLLRTLAEVGLGYLKLGQPATTLSGGEAQRLKLAAELGRPAGPESAVYLLDEPTTGLHLADVHRLVEVLSRLVDRGGTVVVIEHNLDLVKSADRVVDLGPEGGGAGGRVVAEGTPEQVAAARGSHTGRFLRDTLGRLTPSPAGGRRAV